MRICVFCGSSRGIARCYADAAVAMGEVLGERSIELVYGGGRVGLMGAVADAVLAAGGVAIGVIPRALIEREIGHRGLTEMHVVETMHERKTKMAELADGFIALPGGAGTLEEIFEQWTWAQLGIHRKPCAFLNVNGYYDSLQDMIETMVREEFLRSDYAAVLRFDSDPAAILDSFGTYAAPATKWETPAVAP
jgi:uncharacterized protein (TIGR00730 family)